MSRDVDLSRLEQRVESVPEAPMRRALVAEWLGEASAADGFAAVAALVRRPRGADALRLAVCELLADARPEGPGALSYDTRAALYSEAREQQDEEVMRFLRTPPAPEEALADPATRLSREIAEIPLGRRRSLAKGPERHLLEQLARDPDPIVICHLLRNPRISEPDVVSMAAMRPIPATTLEEIARSPRWSVRVRVQSAVARNPYTPVEVALRMIALLPAGELRAMRGDPDLHAETQAFLEVELGRRI
jgi:hypothetical protein